LLPNSTNDSTFRTILQHFVTLSLYGNLVLLLVNREFQKY